MAPRMHPIWKPILDFVIDETQIDVDYILNGGAAQPIPDT